VIVTHKHKDDFQKSRVSLASLSHFPLHRITLVIYHNRRHSSFPARVLAYTPTAVKLRELNFRKFFAELKRRNAYKVAIAYGVVASLFSHIATNFTALSILQPCYLPTSLLRITRRIAVLPRSIAPFLHCYAANTISRSQGNLSFVRQPFKRACLVSNADSFPPST
jgi:hypothetical protein